MLTDFLQTGPSHMLKKLSKGIFSGVLSSMPSFIAYHTPEWKSHAKIGFALSYLSYKFEQPETTRDRAKVYLAVHHVRRLLQKLF